MNKVVHPRSAGVPVERGPKRSSVVTQEARAGSYPSAGREPKRSPVVQRGGSYPLTGRWPLVGRDAELGRFAEALADRWSQGFVVCGPPGAGKSRLVEELVVAAEAQGYQAVRAATSEAASTVPYGAVAHLLPPDVHPANPVAGFMSVSRALAGTRDRLVVLVDDLNLLDQASVVLMRQLMDVGLIFVVGAVTSGGPASEAVAALPWDAGVHRADIAELGEDAVDELLRAVLGGPVGRRTLHELVTLSGGNALYLRELVLGALRAGTLTSDGTLWELAGDPWPVTPRLAELVGARLAAAGETARPVLETLALCGPFGPLDLPAPPRTLIELEQSGLVRARAEGRRVSVALAHPLYGTVLRSRTPLIRRRATLLRQAERLESCGARRPGDARRVAAWRLAATGTAGAGLLIRAAEEACRAGDHAGAAGLLAEVPEAERTGAFGLLYGEALLESGRGDEAEAVLADVCERATEQERHAALRLRARNLLRAGAGTEVALRLNGQALDRVPGGMGRELLLADRAAILTMSGRPAEAVALLDALPPRPPRDGDPAGWLWAATAKATGLALLSRTREAWNLATVASGIGTPAMSVAERAGSAPHPAAALTPLVPLVLAAAEDGRLAEARDIAVRGTKSPGDDVVAGGEPRTWIGTGHAMWAATVRARVEWLAGRVAAARCWYAEAAALARGRGQVPPMRLVLSGLCASAAVLGDVEAARAALVELRAYPATPLFAGEDLLGEAWLAAAEGRLAEARAVLTGAAASARDAGRPGAEALLLTDVARLGGARQVTERLAELAEVCDGALTAAHARLAHALAANDPDGLTHVAETLAGLGADLHAAEAATVAAAAWRREGSPRQAAAATARAVELRSRCEGADTPLLAAGHEAVPLTVREREVALLAAGGVPSKDIARTLVLSVRTVDNHLQKVYTKLGVTTRRDLAVVLGGTTHGGPAGDGGTT
ncbi:LuxR family transcriptional regulator [Sphaerisporangium rubeum]|uniref:DNA-binding CsgD family transcriptional regulator/thioredoxin-like negative regulator of GroEL n=1 Tax=Sphaerisporangium rubeum TaxID=321317 RepID=A0A7X0MA31_9ACTN|nr:LuxR family transcriptional regulator [Sphaerisporangium rubeum]MBB6475669.1 DNA-binding CsgD family transcriptional regulator/thioredoxin-like negative regulator of GroEL [Sphaerisporangium rubeum]